MNPNLNKQQTKKANKYTEFWNCCKEGKVKVTQLCPTLCDPMDYLSMEFSRPEYWSG